MDVARDAALEIDRLVVQLHRAVAPAHGPRLAEMAREVGLDSLEYLPYLGEFLLAGALTRDLVEARAVYWPPAAAPARVDELEAKGLAEGSGPHRAAAPRLRPLLEAMLVARADVAATAWAGHETDVTTATDHARTVAEAATPDHVVAVAHRHLPVPADPYLRLHHVLTTVRYVRHHDHVAAWASRGLTVAEIAAMTALWHGEEVGGTTDGLAALVAAGLAAVDPPRLTDAGRTMRNEIEADTNRRAAVSFAVLGHDAATEFLASLRALPTPGA